MRYDIVQGDLEPPIQSRLTGCRDSIAGAVVTFVMKQIDGPVRISSTAVIDDPVKRIVHYVWASGDTATPGVYRAQWQVVYGSAFPETWPSDDALYIVIHPKL